MNKKQYTVNVLVNGKPVREYRKDNLVYVQGNEGTHYEIDIKNNSWNRVLAVIYVDGHSVVSDENDDSGYVISGHDSVRIKGFRTSMDTEAEFIFSKKGSSRAQKVKGNAKDAGVIGVRIYEERFAWLYGADWEYKPQERPVDNFPDYNWYTISSTLDPHHTYGITQQTTSNTTPCNAVQCSYTTHDVSPAELSHKKGKFDLGTKMGSDVTSRVITTTFERGTLAAQFALHYTSREQLHKMGIELRNRKQIYTPRPFSNFCKRPS